MLPRTVKFKDPEKRLYRRLFGVTKAELVQLAEYQWVWKLTRARGAQSYLPLYYEAHFGRSVDVTAASRGA